MATQIRIFDELKSRGIVPDNRQREAIDALLQLVEESAHKVASRLTSAVAGAYLWGQPGRGKTMLMDSMFKTFDLPKRRIHFHEFLREINHHLVEHTAMTPDRLRSVSRHWIGNTRLLCFDEFHVHDIADAILMGRFLEIAVDMGVRVVLTSNYAPLNLFPDQEFHHRFLPTISLIETRFYVIHLDGARDYRYDQSVAADQRFLHTSDAQANELIARILQEGYPDIEVQPQTLLLSNRPIPARAACANAVWFDFFHLCMGNRSHLDYLEIAERWRTVAVSNIQRCRLLNPDALRRFIWLIDILYDRKIKLLLSSEMPIDELLADVLDSKHDLCRTRSRLQEMQSIHFAQPERYTCLS